MEGSVVTSKERTETFTFRPLYPLQDDGFVRGASPAVNALNAMVEHLAGTTIPVFLVGESGTGKEVYARMIHRLSGGDATSLKKISCAATEPAQLSRALKELREVSEREKIQTLFLDEIEELSPECQNQLLTLVPNGEFLSGEGTFSARVISATTCNMESEVAQGRFRRELYFRLNGACLRLPPLRDRTEDIPALIQHFLFRHPEELKKSAPVVNQETMELLMSYPWPGNIRELENLARKMVALGDTSLAVSDLRMARMVLAAGMGVGKVSSLKMAAKAASRQTERELILQALQRTKWNRKRAARDLQISYKSLLCKLKQIETMDTNGEESRKK
jgi:two-component system, NtrC family, response regulator AtoC